MKIQIPKAAEVHIFVNEDEKTIVVDIDNGEHIIEIDNVDYFRVCYPSEITV